MADVVKRSTDETSMYACLVQEPPMPDACDARRAQDGTTLEAFAREWSPRVETVHQGVVVLDAAGLTRLFGAPRAWARQLAAAARDRGWRVRVAVAGTRVASVLLALARPGVVVTAAGEEAAAVASLPLSLLVQVDMFGAEAAPATPTESSARRRRKTAPARHYRLAPAPDPAVMPSPDEPSSVSAGDQRREVRRKGTVTGGHARARGSHARASAAAATRAAEAAARLETLARWGLHTLGDLAALPAADIAARLGAAGARWHERACGRDQQPLVNTLEEPRFEARLDLEWPIEGLEPLSFVLARLLEPLCARLVREERGAAVLETRLDLVSRTAHVRTLQLPAPMNDPKVLRTLALLDLEAHPPAAGIDRVHVRLDPMPGRRVQFSLLRRPLPAPDQVATLMARLNALVGEGRCGSPQLLDTHRPGAFALLPFAPREEGGEQRRQHVGAAAGDATGSHEPACILRRFRPGVPVHVRMENGRPLRLVVPGGGVAGGFVEECAGPWRSSGAWWRQPSRTGAWDHDEWDVAVRGGAVYRLSCKRKGPSPANDDGPAEWAIEGVWD